MGDNRGPFGLSIGCKVIYSRVDPAEGEQHPIGCVTVRRHSWHGHYCSVRAFAVNPARQRPRPCGLRGL